MQYLKLYKNKLTLEDISAKISSVQFQYKKYYLRKKRLTNNALDSERISCGKVETKPKSRKTQRKDEIETSLYIVLRKK